MNGRRTGARTRYSRATSTKAVQEKLLAAAADKGAEIPRVRSPVNGGLVRDATHEQTAKRTRLTGAQRLGAEEAEQADKTARLRPPKRRDTSLLVDPKVEGLEQGPPTTRLRKRQIDSDGDDDDHEIKRARLTRQNLARFDKMGGEKASNKASAHLDSTDESTTTIKTISTTSSGFEDQAYKNGILDPLYSKPPTNIEEIHERHARSRATASPTESEYKRYARAVGKVGNEATMVFEVGGRMLKWYDDDGYIRSFNRAFTAFPKDVGFNDGLSAPQPDFVEGLEKREYRPVPVGEYVQGAVLFKDDRHSVTLPHVAGEWKGPGKDMAKATLQGSYDGAALVYARNKALSLAGKPDPPGHAEVRTFTTDGTNINFYAHYAAPSEEGGTLEYHQYQYATANVKDTHQGHKDGYRGIRNEQDHARDRSCALRDELKTHWKQRRGAHQPIAEETLPAGIPEEPLPDDHGEVEEPPPSAKPTRHKRTNRKAPARGTGDDSRYEITNKPSYAPTPPRSSEERRRSTRLANARQQSSDDPANTTAKKHKSNARTTADYWQ